jgi:hypothetical protein
MLLVCFVIETIDSKVDYYCLARGLDIVGVRSVINYTMPPNHKVNCYYYYCCCCCCHFAQMDCRFQKVVCASCGSNGARTSERQSRVVDRRTRSQGNVWRERERERERGEESEKRKSNNASSQLLKEITRVAKGKVLARSIPADVIVQWAAKVDEIEVCLCVEMSFGCCCCCCCCCCC